MKKEFYDEIREKHPHLFEVGPRESVIAFGFETSDGWNDLLRDLFDNLSESVRLYQVKSKFAGLRVYAKGCTQRDNELINEAEQKSYKICEVCGKPGTQHTDRGWISTVCEEHQS